MQLEESLGDHLRWSLGIKAILHTGTSPFQTYELVDSNPFGKVRSCGSAAAISSVSHLTAVAQPQLPSLSKESRMLFGGTHPQERGQASG